MRVAELDLIRDLHRLDLRRELADLVERPVPLVDHHVADARHARRIEALDVEPDVVTRLGPLVARVVHLDAEDLAADTGTIARGQEGNFLVGLDDALLDAAGNDVAHTLELVETRHGQAHGGALVAARRRADLVEIVVERDHVHLLLVDPYSRARPPEHRLALLGDVIAPSRERGAAPARSRRQIPSSSRP